MHQSSLAVALVRKLIAVLESTERLPVITYDHGGSGSGLQVNYCILAIALDVNHEESLNFPEVDSSTCTFNSLMFLVPLGCTDEGLIGLDE